MNENELTFCRCCSSCQSAKLPSFSPPHDFYSFFGLHICSGRGRKKIEITFRTVAPGLIILYGSQAPYKFGLKIVLPFSFSSQLRYFLLRLRKVRHFLICWELPTNGGFLLGKVVFHLLLGNSLAGLPGRKSHFGKCHLREQAELIYFPNYIQAVADVTGRVGKFCYCCSVQCSPRGNPGAALQIMTQVHNGNLIELVSGNSMGFKLSPQLF